MDTVLHQGFLTGYTKEELWFLQTKDFDSEIGTLLLDIPFV